MVPGAALRLEDILLEVFGFGGTAALRVTPLAPSEFVVTSRTYNLTDEGTFGQFLGGVVATEAIEHGGQAAMIQLSHHGGSSTGSRTNVGFVNCGESWIVVSAELYRSDGNLLGTIEYDLGPHMHKQANRIFQGVTSDDIDDGYVVVTTTTPAGRFLTYASVVDNASGDPIYIPGMPVNVEPPPPPTPTPTVGVPVPMNPLETMIEISEWFGSEPGQGDLPDLKGVAAQLQQEGLEAILDDVVEGNPGIATRTGTTIRGDFGNGYVLSDGTFVTGETTVDFSNITISSERVAFDATVSHQGLQIDGGEPPVDSLTASLDLEVNEDGHVMGSTTVTSGGKQDGNSIHGSVFVNTVLCLNYPTGGSIEIEIGGEVHVFTFTPDCEESAFEYQDPDPGWDFTYSSGNPADAQAQEYIDSTSNVYLSPGPPLYVWIPSIGGLTFEETEPGVIIYKFEFDQIVEAAELMLNMPTFHWSYSRGHNFLYGSADGVDWVQLQEVLPPEFAAANAGVFNDRLPSSMTGTQEIWLRVELYSFGERAPEGPPWTNTAQFSRWDENVHGTIFRLNARFED